MADPGVALLVGVLCLAILAIVFWPQKGLTARWQRWSRASQRVRMEDALKHLYDCEYKKVDCTQQSIAGTLSISGDESAQLLSRLETYGLLRTESGTLTLTAEGRSYALRVIRVHRLWERYLSEETGMVETDWHHEAERQEHRISTAEADALARQMGNPPFDPHGDPIPTASGELPKPKGQPLATLEQGMIGTIVHIEDEPPIIYDQIAALGLTPGMRVRFLNATRERVEFEAEGNDHVLTPIAAGNITVYPLTNVRTMEGPFETLASLGPGETGTVIAISRTCRGLQRRRLLDLGLVPGTTVEAEMRSAAGDPTAYRIRGAAIALRSKQAELIHIKRSGKQAA